MPAEDFDFEEGIQKFNKEVRAPPCIDAAWQSPCSKHNSSCLDGDHSLHVSRVRCLSIVSSAAEPQSMAQEVQIAAMKGVRGVVRHVLYCLREGFTPWSFHTSASGLQEVKPEVEKESTPSEKVYEKDDFFDQLSCEALERLNVGAGGGGQPGQPGKLPPRTRFAEQRKLDIETFGGTGIARRNNYGRGHGRRGRGVRTFVLWCSLVLRQAAHLCGLWRGTRCSPDSRGFYHCPGALQNAAGDSAALLSQHASAPSEALCACVTCIA